MTASAESIATHDAAKAGPTEADDPKRLSLLVLSLLALGLGIFTGFGAVLFRDLISLIHNLFFNGTFSLSLRRQSSSPRRAAGDRSSSWRRSSAASSSPGWSSNFAPEAKGHGVPEVMDAIYYKEGKIRPIVALVKSVASAFAIGSGSSVGREGPIIQIGSALGSTLGQIIHMPVGQRIALVAAGAGAGIAATFNTPIGGVMFAIELMLPEVSVATFLPVAIATGAATFVGQWFLGHAPAFVVPPIQAITADLSAIAAVDPLRGARRRHGCRGGRFHPRTAHRRRPVRQDPGTLHAAHHRHARASAS